MDVPHLLLAALALYLAVGGVVALAFVFVGAPRVDAAAKGSSIAFRLLILPGCVLLWPAILRRWRRGPS